jgi:hypothetical protein
MTAPTLRLTLSADGVPLSIAINRADAAPGEPAELQKWHDLAPGESIRLPFYPGALITVAETKRG